jgi:hypothetical protein
MRGAVVRGKLYHEGQTIFGSALVRAYQFENEIARYPRVIVTQEVREDILRYIAIYEADGPHLKIENELKQAPDGPMHLHVLGPIVALLNKNEAPYPKLTSEEKAALARYQGIKPILQERFAASMDNPRHFEKVRWVAEYWNAEIAPRFGLRIHGAGLDPKPGVWEQPVIGRRRSGCCINAGSSPSAADQSSSVRWLRRMTSRSWLGAAFHRGG